MTAVDDPKQNQPTRLPRSRRLTEIAIALPFVGGVCVGIPVLWNTDAEQGAGVATSSAAIYLFSVWFGMIVLAVLLARAFARQDQGA